MYLSVRTSDNDKLNLIDLLEDVIYTLVGTTNTKDSGHRTGQRNSFDFEWFVKEEGRLLNLDHTNLVESE